MSYFTAKEIKPNNKQINQISSTNNEKATNIELSDSNAGDNGILVLDSDYTML